MVFFINYYFFESDNIIIYPCSELLLQAYNYDFWLKVQFSSST